MLRYDPTTGGVNIFVPAGSGGLERPSGLVVDAAGSLYVASNPTHQILRYDATGAFVDAFIPPQRGGLA